MRPFDTMMKNTQISSKRQKSVIQANIEDVPKGTFKKMPLFHQEENAFFKMLSDALNEHHTLFSNIPLDTIIHPTLLSEKAFLAHKNVEYLICEKSSSLPVCAVDVSTTTEPTEAEYFLNMAGISVIHLTDDISSEELRKRIAQAKPYPNMPFPKEIPEIPVTVVNEKDIQRKKAFPKITFKLIEKTQVQKYVLYGMYAIWGIFGAAILFAIGYIVIVKTLSDICR